MQNWYNLPVYYDVSFSHEMSEEIAFLKAAFRLYCKKSKPKLLEPACGTGRLILPLTRSGFDCTGFDLNEHALNYLRKKLRRNHFKAHIFKSDMANFTTANRKFDAAFCTVDTFRHLLTEKQAEQHLYAVSKSLKKNGIYVLGLHLIPERGKIRKSVIRWTNRRGRLTVKTSMTMIAANKKKRTETLKVVLEPETKNTKGKYISNYQLRTYTLKQLMTLLDKTSVFSIKEVFNEYYDINTPIQLNEKSQYAVLVLRKK